MTVQTRATRLSAVVVVDQTKQVAPPLQLLEIADRLMAARKHMARVQTNAEARICETRHKVDELVGIREGLRALAGRRLKQEWAVRRGGIQNCLNGCPHRVERIRQRARCRLPHMDHHTTEAGRASILEVLAQEIHVPVVPIGGHVAQIDDILAVDIDARASIRNSLRSHSQFRVGNGHLGRLWATEEDLVGLAVITEGEDRTGQRLGLGCVESDAVCLAERSAQGHADDG